MLVHRCLSPCLAPLVQRSGRRAGHRQCERRSSSCIHRARASRAAVDTLFMGACQRAEPRQVPTPLDIVAPNSSDRRHLSGADLAADDDARTSHGLL